MCTLYICIFDGIYSLLFEVGGLERILKGKFLYEGDAAGGVTDQRG